MAIGALLLAGQALSAVGSIFGGRKKRRAARIEADLLRRSAEATRSQGGQAEEALRRKQALFLAEQRAGFAQSGVDATSGSALDIQTQSGELAELDAMNLRYETELKALGLLSESEETRRAGRDAETAGYIGAAANVLSGVGQYSPLKG